MNRQLPNESLGVVYAAEYLVGRPVTRESQELFVHAFVGTRAVLGACEAFGFAAPDADFNAIYDHADRTIAPIGISRFTIACSKVAIGSSSFRDMGLVVEGLGKGPSRKLRQQAEEAAVNNFLSKPDHPKLPRKKIPEVAKRDLELDFSNRVIDRAIAHTALTPSPDVAYHLQRIRRLTPKGRQSVISRQTLDRGLRNLKTWSRWASDPVPQYGEASPFFRDLLELPGGHIFDISQLRGTLTGYTNSPQA